MALVNARRGTLLRAATLLLGPAEDAVQDAYVRAQGARTPAPNAAQAWRLTVVRNRAIDRLLRQPPVSARAAPRSVQHAPHAARATAMVGGVVQVGGQLGLVLTLEGVALCVLPLGPRAEQAHDAVVG